MIKAIIFDWSGTLNDNFRSFHQVNSLMLQRLGKQPLTPDELRKEFDTPYMKFWNKHVPTLTKEEQDIMYEKAIHEVEKAQVYDGVKETIHKLHSKGIQLFILSADHYSSLLPEIEAAGLSNLFVEVIGKVHEKEKAIIDIIDKYCLELEETLFIGDTCGDIKEGKKANVKTVGITWGFQDKKKLEESEPNFLIDNISELILIIDNS